MQLEILENAFDQLPFYFDRNGKLCIEIRQGLQELEKVQTCMCRNIKRMRRKIRLKMSFL